MSGESRRQPTNVDDLENFAAKAKSKSDQTIHQFRSGGPSVAHLSFTTLKTSSDT